MTTKFVSIEGPNMPTPRAEIEGPTISAAANDSNDGVNPEAPSKVFALLALNDRFGREKPFAD